MKKPVLLFFLLTALALCQIPVTDFGHMTQTIINGIELVQHGKQLVTTYNKIADTYTHMTNQAKWVINSRLRWRTIFDPITPSSAPDTTGRISGLIGSLNTGVNTSATYAARVTSVNGNLSSIPARAIASLDMTDGNNVTAARVIGKTQAQSPALQVSLQNLGDDFSSDDPAKNTAADLAKKTGLAVMHTNQILMADLETNQQFLRFKLAENVDRREALVKDINQATHTQQTADAELLRSIHGMTDARAALRVAPIQ